MFGMGNEFEKYTKEEHNAYFVLALAKEYSIPVYVLLDYDLIEQKEIIKHIFIRISNYLFLDKMGAFKIPEERIPIDNFDFIRIEKMDYKETKAKLLNQNLRLTDSEMKKHYREWIRNHWIIVNLFFEKEKERWVYFGDSTKEEYSFFVSIHQSGVLNKYIHRITKEKFGALKKGKIEFEERKQYKGNTMNDIFSKI